MIKNTKEYLITLNAIKSFELDMARQLHYTDKINPILHKAVRDAAQSMRDDLVEEVQDFERKYMQGRVGDWMATYTGGMFWLLDPRPEEVYIEDIAHAISLICRYNGHIRGFYSVAQHSVLVSEHCNPKYALYGLLHDASEAYAGDVISPLKKLLPDYKAIEDRILSAVCKRYGIRESKKMKQEVKHWDKVLLATEVRDLLPYKYVNWKIDVEPLKSSVYPLWTPEYSEQRFLSRFNDLYGKRKNRSK